MIGTLFTYYYGKRVARREIEQDLRPKASPELDEMAGARIVLYVILLCLIALFAASMWT